MVNLFVNVQNYILQTCDIEHENHLINNFNKFISLFIIGDCYFILNLVIDH